MLKLYTCLNIVSQTHLTEFISRVTLAFRQQGLHIILELSIATAAAICRIQRVKLLRNVIMLNDIVCAKSSTSVSTAGVDAAAIAAMQIEA